MNGDCNYDSIINITDIVFIINQCILNENDSNDCSCGDLNNDFVVNVLDIVIITNQILFPE